MQVRKIMPADVTGTFQGTAQAFQNSFVGLGLLLVAAILVIYIILGILYESFVHPITILSGLPSAGVGALLTLMIFHQELNLYSFVGIIMLIGIVKKNAIMMIDFALEARTQRGQEARRIDLPGRTDPLPSYHDDHRGCPHGHLPIALGIGAGAESRRGLGLAVVGGLLFSQMVTLYITPVYLHLPRSGAEEVHQLEGAAQVTSRSTRASARRGRTHAPRLASWPNSLRLIPAVSQRQAPSHWMRPPTFSVCVVVPREPLLSDAAHRKYSGRRDHYRINFQAVQCNNEIRCYWWPAIREIYGECACTVRIHRVSTLSHRVSKIGNNYPIHCDRIDLRQRAIVAEGCHGNAFHGANGSIGWSCKLVAFNREAVRAANQSVVASRGIGLRIGSGYHKPAHDHEGH